MSEKFKTFDNLKDIRTGVGFHFTSKEIMQKIFDTGLKPTLGANSSGGLGKEANDKTFISFGLEGMLQLYNRLLHAAFQGTIKDFQNETHASFIPDVAKGRDQATSLTMLEGFEMVRQYMENNVYIVFDCPVGEFQRELSEDEIDGINDSIKTEHGELYKRISTIDEISENLSNDKKSIPEVIGKITASIEKNKIELEAQKDPEKIKKLESKIEIKLAAIEEISGLTEDDRKDFLKRLSGERATLSNEIRAKTLIKIQEKRGSILCEDGKLEYSPDDEPILDRVDFNEDRLRWYDQVRHPHNTHTRMVIDENGIRGIQIGKERVGAYSRDGENPATGLECFEDVFQKRTQADNLAIRGDAPLLDLFSEYLKLVEKYKSEGLLYVKPEHDIVFGNTVKHFEPRECMDLTDVRRYDGLEAFAERLESFYKEFIAARETAKIASKQEQEKSGYTMQKPVVTALEAKTTMSEINDVDRMFAEYTQEKENESEVTI